MRGKYQKISQDTRERVINAYLLGHCTAQISQFMSLKKSTVGSIIKSYLETGTHETKQKGRNQVSKLNEDQQKIIVSWIDDDATISLKALKRKCEEHFSISVSQTTIFKYVKGFKYSLKRIHLLPERRNDEKSITERRIYSLKFLDYQADFGDANIIFIDECGFNVSMRPSRGRSIIGTPAVLVVPQIRSRNISICCAMNRSGIVYYTSQNRAYNSNSFAIFLNNLIDTLLQHSTNTSSNTYLFIMDNVRFHKTSEVLKTLSNRKISFEFLPPYSPFLNTIENMFSKWKDIVKRSSPQNESELMEIIAKSSSLLTSTDCEGYYRNMLRYIPRCINNELIKD